MKMRLNLGLFFFFISIFFFYSLSFSQSSSYENRKDCLNNFNIGLALSDEGFLEKTKIGKTLLFDYIKCRIAAKYDDRECNNFYGEDAKVCIEQFEKLKKFAGFYSRLFLSDEITPELLRDCPIPGVDMKTCEKFIKAIRRGDDSICKRNDYDCIAVIKLDVSLARTQMTRDRIYFIKAMKDLKIANCLKIKDKKTKRECQAYITRDISICEEDEAFKRVRNAYCRYHFK